MKTQLLEFISLIGAGCMREADIERIADEAAQAYADPAAFLAANPDINYDDTFPIPLGEWVVLGSLPDTVVFQADSYQALFSRSATRSTTACRSPSSPSSWPVPSH